MGDLVELDELKAGPRIITNANDKYIPAVLQFLKDYEYTYDAGVNGFKQGVNSIKMSELALLAKVQIKYGKRILTKDQIMACLMYIREESREHAMDELKLRVNPFDYANVPELERWLRAVMVPTVEEETFADALCVMRHWIWLVKRTVNGMEQKWNLMPIFWGGQGGGKSTQIKRLIEPIGQMATTGGFQLFLDQFAGLTMNYNYVLFLDEMAQAEKAEAAKVKACIDGNIVPGRGMYSDDVRKLIRNASFIAATNEPPPHGFVDTTGARRFYSIECNNEPVIGARAELMNSFDYLKLWHSVDMKAEPPILERRERIELKQNTDNRTQTTLEQFWDECVVLDPAAPNMKWTDFRIQYLEFCKKLGMQPKRVTEKVIKTYLGEKKVKTTKPGNRLQVHGITINFV